MIKPEEKLEFGGAVSPQLDEKRPIFNWYKFRHGYSKELVARLLDIFCISTTDYVLDPFCGSGTTLLACQDQNVSSVGCDILPFAVFLTNVKLKAHSYDVVSLRKEAKKITATIKKRTSAQSSPELKIFTPEVLGTLFLIKEKIHCISSEENRDFFILGLLGILDKVSKRIKAGGFLRTIRRKVDATNVLSLFKEKIYCMISDVEGIYGLGNCKKSLHESIAFVGDARRLALNKKFDAVITSPPYPNRHDYTRIYAPELLMYFLRGEELKRIRYSSIRSHVEAKEMFTDGSYREPKKLQDLLSKIAKNQNNGRIAITLRGYFEDMYISLKEISRCLKDGGHAALVTSNVRFAGIMIPVDIFIAEIGSQVNLEPRSIWIARYKGNSPQQMRRYGKLRSRESMVVFEKK